MHPFPPTDPAETPSAKRRGPAILIAAILILALPAIALANHQFSDVPTSSPFHTNISNLVGSGITAGCASSRYCPTSSVTREQMAAFLNRGLGRAGLGNGLIGFSEADNFYTATVQLDTGGASGGIGFVTLAATITAFSDAPGVCPCRGNVFLVDIATGEFSDVHLFVVSDGGFGDDVWAGTASSQWVFAAPSNRSRTYGLAVSIETTGAPPPPPAGSGSPTGGTGTNAVILGTISAEYSPFGSEGGSTLGVGGGSSPTWTGALPENNRRVAPAD